MPTAKEKDAYAKKYYSKMEKTVEQKSCAYAKSLGCWVVKFKSSQNRGVPDRLFITPDGVVFFIEYKKPKVKKPSPQQKLVIDEMAEHGAIVFVYNALDDANAAIFDMVTFGEHR